MSVFNRYQHLLTTFSHGGHLSQPLLTIMNHIIKCMSAIYLTAAIAPAHRSWYVWLFSRPFQSKSDKKSSFLVKSKKSYGIPMVFLWYSYGIPMVSIGFNRFYGGPLHQESSKWRWSLWCSCFSMTRFALASDVANGWSRKWMRKWDISHFFC